MVIPWQAIPSTIFWVAFGLVLLYGSVWLFDRIDPINYREAIRQGNIAAGLVVSAVILAMGGIIITILAT
jgi:uncharacterized membrane protein YjfL (UPF0719 family)